MKFTLEQSPRYAEPEITLRCGALDERLAALVRHIQLYAFSVAASRDGRQYSLPLEDIFYFESVDDKTFACTAEGVYQCAEKLYELEGSLTGTSFARIAKACLANTARVESVRPLLASKLEATLQNGERLIVNRHYVPGFKAKFGIGKEQPHENT